MKNKIYETQFKKRSKEYTSLHNLINENYIHQVLIPGEGLLNASTDVYFCTLNNCPIVIKERTGTSAGSFANFTIANEKSLAKIVQTKELIEKKTNLKLNLIKYSI